ncbi:MAG: hypothetical protein QXX12_00635 [Nanopusillaceae archaeon]
MPKVESGFNAQQDRILFAILQGNSDLLEQLTQTIVGKAAFMRVYKDNYWFMDNDPTAMQAILNSSTAMQAIANSSTAMQAIANSSTAMQAILNSSTAMQAILNSSTAMQAIASSPVAMNALLKSSSSIKAMLRSSSIAVNAILSNLSTLQNQQFFSRSAQQQTYGGNGTSTYTIPSNSLIHITNLYSYDSTPSDVGASGTVTLIDEINQTQIGSYNMTGSGSTTTNIDVNLLCFGNLTNIRNVSGQFPSGFRLRITFTVYTAL